MQEPIARFLLALRLWSARQLMSKRGAAIPDEMVLWQYVRLAYPEPL